MRNAPNVQRTLAALSLAVAAASLQGCIVHDCTGCGSDRVTLLESEPNDQASQADEFGPIGAHDSLAIRGAITELGPDFYDGFAFVAEQPIDVQLSLVADDPNADLDVCVFDPLINDYVACFATPNRPETGTFSVLESGREFHLVVTSFSGASTYTLFVDTAPVSLAANHTGGAIAAPAARVAPERMARFAGYQRPTDLEVDALAPFYVGELIELDDQGGLRRRAVFGRREAN